MSTYSLEATLRDAVARPAELVLALGQAAAGAFSLTCVYLARHDLLMAEALAIGVAAAGLVLAAWAGLDRLQELPFSRQEWASWKAGVSARMGMLAFVNLAPVSLAVVINHYWLGAPLAAFAAAVLLATWTATAVLRLQASAAGVASKGEELEGGAGLGLALLGVTLLITWTLALVDRAFGHGTTPTLLSGDGAIVLSYSIPVLVGLGSAMALYLPSVLRRSPDTVARLALCMLAVPLIWVMLVPMKTFGEPGTPLLPDYLRMMPGRLFLSVVLAITLVQAVRSWDRRLR